MSGVVYSPRARADLDEIWDYTADRWDIEQGDSYVRGLIEACAMVASGTRRGRDASDIRPGYFKFAYISHVVFYHQINGDMDVVRVLHQQMDVSRHLD